MATTLYLRDSTTNQLSSVGTVVGGSEGQTGGVAYRDALTTRGGASTTAVVNSTASGTNIQWTKTAGGALIEWISGYTPAGGFTLSGLVTVRVRGLESSMNNNVGLRIRLYKRKVNGDEDSLGPFDDGVELGTADAAQDWTFTPSAMVFAEYDRWSSASTPPMSVARWRPALTPSATMVRPAAPPVIASSPSPRLSLSSPTSNCGPNIILAASRMH
jgi:hypothetical protein